jgi:uncharacterized protein (DUF1697 family)
MANRFVALLFSIGIADGRRLIMADWRAMMEAIGLQNPQTLIATGNAVFESHEADVRELEASLEDAFEQRFGRRVDTIVRAAAPFRRTLAGNPFPKESKQDGSRVVVRVMRQPLKKNVESTLEPYLTQGERVKVVRGNLWVHFPQEPNRSRLMSVLGSRRLGIGTVRNWNTMCRLREMLDPTDRLARQPRS